MIDKHIISAIGGVRLERLRPEWIDEMLPSMVENGYARSTARLTRRSSR